MYIDNNDIFHCYKDIWKSTNERLNMIYQWIGSKTILKHRINTGDESNDTDEAVTAACRLQFESLQIHMQVIK